jgi:hypothetical protein
MGWRDLLQTPGETLVSPWVGGRSLRTYERTWNITGRLPKEFSWVTFELTGRKARCGESTEAPFGVLKDVVRGYLVGDRLVPEGTPVPPTIKGIIENFEQVHLIEPGLGRFVRVSAGRFCEGGPLIYEGQDMPLGPEEEVQAAFLDQAKNVDKIAGVVPALDAAFRIEAWRRKEAVKARLEAERKRREEEERLAREERRRQLQEQLGDGAGRREMAQLDFEEAARAALAVGGATLLDHRQAYNRGEMIVQFRLNRRRFECTCDRNLRIIDSGICLIDHATGRKDDNLLTLESLPGVIQEAMDIGRLVVFRHLD